MPQQRLLVLFAFLSTSVHAQWLNFPTPGTPRTHDGKPNLAAPSPLALDGKSVRLWRKYAGSSAPSRISATK